MASDHSEFDPLAGDSVAAQFTSGNINHNNAPARSLDALDPFGAFSSASSRPTNHNEQQDNINTSNVNQQPANANSTNSSVAAESPSAASQADPFAGLYQPSSQVNSNNQPIAPSPSPSVASSTVAAASDIQQASQSATSSVAGDVQSATVPPRTSPAPVEISANVENSGRASTAVEPAPAPTPTQFNFQAFLSKMRDEKAFNLVKQIKGFISKFTTPVLNPDEAVPLIRQFLDGMCDQVAQHELWKDETDDGLDNAYEGLEKYVMSKIHRFIFKPSGSDDALQNQALSDRMTMLSFIRPEHLDVSALVLNHRDKLAEAQTELIKMDSYKSPRDKIICILNCARVLMSVLTSTDEAGGADEFLPLLIYVILQSQPPNLHCNLMFITRFRDPNKLMGEAGYYLTNMQGAVSFIQTVTASQLSIDSDEFDRHLNQTLETMYSQQEPAVASQAAPTNPAPYQPNADKQRPTRPPPPRPGQAEMDVRSRADTITGASLAAAQRGQPPAAPQTPGPPTRGNPDDSFNVSALVEGAGQRPIPRFLQCADAADLRLGDVQTLLRDYQRLAQVNDELIRTINLNLAM